VGKKYLLKQYFLMQKKRKLCEENGIALFYYANAKYDFPYKVFIKKENLLKEIKRD
jgi:hypothetical protein